MAVEHSISPAAARRRRSALSGLLVCSLVWAGVLLGVSFLATPVKFLAPSLSLPVALDVGRQTFWWFSRVELVFAVAALACAAVAEIGTRRKPRTPPACTVLTALLVVVVGSQVLWLLPLLDARVELILEGATPPPSQWHTVYIVVETAKLAAVAIVAWVALRRLIRAPTNAPQSAGAAQ